MSVPAGSSTIPAVVVASEISPSVTVRFVPSLESPATVPAAMLTLSASDRAISVCVTLFFEVRIVPEVNLLTEKAPLFDVIVAVALVSVSSLS